MYSCCDILIALGAVATLKSIDKIITVFLTSVGINPNFGMHLSLEENVPFASWYKTL